MRVYDLAKELGLGNKELLAILQKAGSDVKSAISVVEASLVHKLRAEHPKPAATPPPTRPVSPTPPVKPAAAPAAAAAARAPEAHPPVAPKAPHPAKPAAKPAIKPAPRAPAAPPPPPPPAGAGPKAAAEKPAPKPVEKPPAKAGGGRVITLRGAIIVRELAEQLGLKPNQLIAELMLTNVFATINERLDLKIAQQIAEKHGFVLEHEKKAVEQKAPIKKAVDEEAEMDLPGDLVARPPVVTFLGHIDHGKTSLLDRIRNTAVAKSEAGGITQHIGAYMIEHRGQKITFLDTPGHAAFTAMRARGAHLTDVAVIVIAGDDGIMPQTEEAIKHAQAAKTTILIAINKMDLPAASVDRVKRQLQAMGLVPEDWGGNVICCPVSAVSGQGLDHLLEMILLQAEILELKANPKARARGYVIEAQLEPGMGPMATLLVTRGTLHVGDAVLCGPYWGRVKALLNDHGIKVRTAGPSTPVKCMGLSGVPQAGESFKVFADDKLAREMAGQRSQDQRAAQMVVPKKASLDNLFAQIEKDRGLELNLLLKCDTQGSLEAIQKALEDIRSEKVALTIVMTGIGNINENDVLLASASNAIIIGFNVSKEPGVTQKEKQEGVEIRLYSIIYQILDQIKEAMTGLLAPELREKFMGRAEVRQVFPISKKGKVAGCLVSNGRIHTRCRARVKRKGDILAESAIATLKRFQDDVSEVREGQECGIRLENFADFEPGDMIEFFEIEKIPQKL